MRTKPLTALKRRISELLPDIERDKGATLITRHGQPSAYLMGVETCELMRRRLSALEGIARGEQAVAEGRVVSHAQARKRLARWLE